MYVLGIDGGGTKTNGVVADENGNVFMQTVTSRSNPNTLSKAEFEKVMSDLILELKTQKPDIFEEVTVCFAGMAGVGESGRDVELTNLLKKYLPTKTQVFVNHDAINALYSGTLGAPGIVQIAGTGSITFGMNEVDKTARSGGWGYLFDDEGSGFYMGNEALRAIFQDFDGRGFATDLTGLVLKHYNVSYVPDIIGQVYGHEHPRSAIAPLSKYVVEAAVANDEVAKNIILKACESMVSCIHSCHRQLFEENHQTIIVLSGSVFTNAQLFIQLLNEFTSEAMPNVEFRQTQVSPVGGAVVAGLLSQNLELGKHFAKQMNEQMQN